jgi:prolyl 4-hydroxylase
MEWVIGGGSGTKGEAEPPKVPSEEPGPKPEAVRGSHLFVDDFLPQSDALALRSHVDAHFEKPETHGPQTHQVWNYWHVPALYTYLRTQPEKLIPEPLVRAFYDRLTAWAKDRLGMGHVTWPNLSLYVDGCAQGLHNDSLGGRFGFVYSLTRDDRNGRGGETMVVKEGDLFRANLASASAGPGLYDLIAPRFNRLALFDDRVPHGVQRIEGSMDPLDGRLVLHGHISESGPFVEGPHDRDEVWALCEQLVERLIDGGGTEALYHHGPLVLRVTIGADGGATTCRVLVDRVARSDGGDPRPLVDRLIAAIAHTRFPAAGASSEATLPIMLGQPLPFLAKEQKRKPGSGAAPAQPGNQRAAIGAAVRARLDATEGVAKVPKDKLEAYVAPDFLSPEECRALIELIDERRIPSGLLAPHPDPEFRTSESCNLNALDPTVTAIEQRINALMGIAPANGETVQGQRYAVGQQFKPHHDFFHTDQAYWEDQQRIGGQRTWTVMAFLNEPEAGGQTMFPNVGLRVTPAAGYLFIWNNLDGEGEPNPLSLHQGLPVEAGVKYVITKWYRERPWGVQQA